MEKGTDLLDGADKRTNRALAERLDHLAQASKRQIVPGDYTLKAVKTIARDMTDEMLYELAPERVANSAVGWYGRKQATALDEISSEFNLPELATSKGGERCLHSHPGKDCIGCNEQAHSTQV